MRVSEGLFTEAYTSRNKLVRIFKVEQVSEEIPEQNPEQTTDHSKERPFEEQKRGEEDHCQLDHGRVAGDCVPKGCHPAAAARAYDRARAREQPEQRGRLERVEPSAARAA